MSVAMATVTSTPLSSELPPAYSAQTRAPAYTPPAPAVLPSSAQVARPQMTERTFPLGQLRKEPWAYLKIKSRGSATERPQFFAGDAVEGSVDLTVQNGDTTIRSVTVYLRGIIALADGGPGGATKKTFLEVAVSLWVGECLFGTHSWPFNIPLPTECGIGLDETHKGTWPLPPSFMEAHARFSIQYQVYMHVRRTLLHGDSRHNAVINYSPLVSPSIFSPLRQLTYIENLPHLIGPSGDPTGWETSAPVTMSGTLFGSHRVNADCTLSLAAPLCYTRSSLVPLVLTIESSEPEALHFLAETHAPVVRLMRHASAYPKLAMNTPDNIVKSMDDFWTETRVVSEATWWASTEGASENGTRVLSGELRVPGNLKPACIFGNVRISYSVVLQPSRATAFVPTAKAKTFLLSIPVDIATAFARGPRPRSLAPPAYDAM